MPLPHLWLHLPTDSAPVEHFADREVKGWAITRNVGFGNPDANGWVRIPADGRYRIDATLLWAANNQGRRAIFINRAPGGQPFTEPRRIPFPVVDKFCTCTISEPLWLDTGEYVRLGAFQTSGSGLALRGLGDATGTSLKVTCEELG